MATSPRIASSSSIWVTCRSVVQPLEDQDTADVSGISLDGSGPDRSRSARMSRANPSFAVSHRCTVSVLAHAVNIPRYSGRSDIGRIIALSSRSVRSTSSARVRCSGR